MRLSLRFVLPLMLVLTAFAYAVSPLVDRMTLRWFMRDLDIRSALIANTIGEPLFDQLAAGRKVKIADFFARITQDERLFAIGYCAAPKRLSGAVAAVQSHMNSSANSIAQWAAVGALEGSQEPVEAMLAMPSEPG